MKLLTNINYFNNIICGKQLFLKPSDLKNANSMKRFPKEENKRKQWLNACKISDKTLFSTSVICSKHFMKENFDHDKDDFTTRIRILKNDAVPSIFDINRELTQLKSQLIDGKKIAQDIQTQLRDDIKNWSAKTNRQPTLVAILVGDDPASLKYIEKKMEAAKFVGINSWTETLSNSITENNLIKKIEELNCNPSVDGILVQLPVPKHISETKVCQAVVPSKDVDGFHMMNMGKLCLNIDTFVPCTVLAVIELLKRYEIPTFGKNVVVCGRSKYIGLPLSIILNSDAKYELPGMEATITLCHRNTPPEQLKTFTKTADIVISATGVIGLIKADMIKEGACVIDVGTNRITTKEGKVKLVGDVDFKDVSEVAGHITPVPGGVGPMTVTMLMQNTFKAAFNREIIQ